MSYPNSGYTYPIVNSDGSFSSTIEDFGDVFVPQELFLNSNFMAWGSNALGQLGLGNIVHRSSPSQVGSLTNWKLVAAGKDHAIAIKTDGTLWTWGRNTNGQLGLGNVVSRSSPVQVGSLTNWRGLGGGNANLTAAITTNGGLWLWGRNSYGQLGLGDQVHRSSPVQVGSLGNWKQVHGGLFSVFSVKTDGTLWAWGDNRNGQLGLDDIVHRSSPVQVGSLTSWKQVANHAYQTAAIKTDGTLWTWGFNQFGSLGLGDLVHRSSPVQVGSLTNWRQIATSTYTMAAIKTDGTLWTWGNSTYGILGLGDTGIPRSSPVQVGSLTNWKQVDAGGFNIGAVKTDGTLWLWGQNEYYGYLGQNDLVHRSSPTQVGSLTNWKLVSTGDYHCLGIQSPDLP